MDHLSEQIIQHTGLQFLKAYYKQRERSGETTVIQDLMTPEGIIADGYLSFPLPDGKPFIATLEATSSDKIEEVMFKINHKLLIWEGFAFACLCSAFFMGIAFSKDWINLWDTGWFKAIIIANTLLLCIWVVYQIFFRNLPRYRYIYAIEQFKQYHADEQWIAIGQDVFTFPGDKVLEELKRQCVTGGFGLLEIKKDESVLLLITPARQETFEGYRKILSFLKIESAAGLFTNNIIFRKLRKDPRLVRYVNALRKASSISKIDSLDTSQLKEAVAVNYNRFMKSFWQQKLLSGVALLIVMAVFYTEYLRRPVAYVSAAKYEEIMSGKAQKLEKQGSEYLLEKAYTVPYSTETSTYLTDETTVSEDADDTAENIKAPGLYLSSENGYVSYECDRLNLTGVKYIVQDGVYSDFTAARDRINVLNEAGYVANCIALDCISNRKGYIVFFELFYNDKENAMSKALRVKSALEADGEKNIQIKVVKLSFE